MMSDDAPKTKAGEVFTFTIEGGLARPRQGAERPDGDLQNKNDSSGGRTADAAFRHHLTTSPALVPIAFDLRADAVRFIRMTQADYAAASFLDERLLTSGVPSAWARWAEVRQAAAGLPARCHFIFHISHVGSTLLSRLVGHHPALFSLREPAILRTLADAALTPDRPGRATARTEWDERLAVFLGLWSRTFDPGQTAVIKATSFVSEIAEHLMDRVAAARSVFMYVPPPTFLKALLGGAMSDITGAAGKRLDRVHRRLGATPWRLEELSAGETVAMSWLSEMLALHGAAARFPTRVLWADFDRFLAAPEAGLVAALNLFGAGAADEAARDILAGPTMSQYAKAPAYRFDARLRAQLLEQAGVQHAAEVRKGMDWLGRAAAAFPAVRDVLEAAAARRHPTP